MCVRAFELVSVTPQIVRLGAASCDGTRVARISQDTKIGGGCRVAVWLLFAGMLGGRAGWVGSVKGLG